MLAAEIPVRRKETDRGARREELEMFWANETIAPPHPHLMEADV